MHTNHILNNQRTFIAIIYLIIIIFLPAVKIFAQHKYSLGLYLAPARSVNPYEVSESEIVIRAYDAFVPRAGLFIDERVSDHFHLTYGAGLMTRDFGFSTGIYHIDSTINTTTFYGGIGSGTGMLIDPDLHIKGLYFFNGQTTKPFIAFGINYYHSINLKKRVRTDFWYSSPDISFRGKYGHITNNGVNLTFETGFTYEGLRLAFSYRQGINVVDTISWPEIRIKDHSPVSLTVFSKGTSIGGSIAWAFPMLKKTFQMPHLPAPEQDTNPGKNEKINIGNTEKKNFFKYGIGVYYKYLKTLNKLDFSPTEYYIKAVQPSRIRYGFYVSYKPTPSFDIQTGFGMMKRVFGLKAGLSKEALSVPGNYSSNIFSTKKSPEVFIKSTYYITRKKIRPYIEIGGSYFRAKKSDLDFIYNGPLVSINDVTLSRGVYTHLSDHGLTLLSGAGVSYKYFQLGLSWQKGLRGVDRIEWQNIQIFDKNYQATMTSKGSGIGGSVAVTVPLP